VGLRGCGLRGLRGGTWWIAREILIRAFARDHELGVVIFIAKKICKVLHQLLTLQSSRVVEKKPKEKRE